MRARLIATAVLSVVIGTELRAAGWVRRYLQIPQARTEALASVRGGGFVLAAAGSPNALVAINADGSVRHARTLPGRPRAVAAAASGEMLVAFAIAGREGIEGIAKLKSDLTPVWSRRLEIGGRAANVGSVDATADGGAIVAGSTFIAKLNAKGRIDWSVALSGAETEIVTIRQTSDGGYVCAGASDTLPWLSKFSSAGTLQWQRRYGTLAGTFRSIVEAQGGGFVAVGVATPHALVVRVGANGEPGWASMTTGGFPGHAVAETPAGYVAAFFAGMEIQLVAFSHDGSIRWRRILTEPNEIEDAKGSLTRMFAAADDGVVFGFPFEQHTLPDGEPGPRLYKMNDAGETACESSRLSSTPVVAVRLSSTGGSSRLLPATVRAKPIAMTTEPVPVTAVVESCHWARGDETKTETWFQPRDPKRIIANAERYRSLLRTKDFDALEKIAADLRRPRFGDPMRPHDDLSHFYMAFSLTDSSEEVLFESLRRWQAARPASITATIALANTLFQAAWDRRGREEASFVTDLGWEEFQRMLEETSAVLKGLEGRGNSDPQYWQLLIAVSKQLGTADFLEVARRGLSVHPDPEIAYRAGFFLLPKWGGSPEAVVAFADQAARLTREVYGDAVYTWFAYQVAADAFSGSADFEDYDFDWERARRGGREAIALAPEWASSYHRLAVLAVTFKDRETARELFSRKELEWFDDAIVMWKNSSRYDDAREWALPKSERKAASVPQMANLPLAAIPSEPLIDAPPEPRVDTSGWPKMLLQTKLTYSGVTYDRIVAFLVKTERGIVAVSAAPPWDDRTDADNVLARLHGQFGSWTMSAPSKPDRVIRATSLLTSGAPNPQLGIALAVKVSSARPPVKPLKIRRFSSMGELGRTLFVVGCTWDSGQCRESVFEGRLFGMSMTKLHALRTIDIGLLDAVSPEAFSGGAVLDMNGDVVAVATARVEGSSPQYKTIVSADVLDTVVP